MGQFATQQDVQNLRQDLRDHMEEDRQTQDRMFAYLAKRFDKLDSLWDDRNIEKGEEKGRETIVQKKEKAFGAAGWTVNAFISLITALATIKMLK